MSHLAIPVALSITLVTLNNKNAVALCNNRPSLFVIIEISCRYIQKYLSHFGGKRYLNEVTRNVLVKNTAVDFFKTVSDLTAGWNNSGQLNIVLFYRDFDQ